MKYLHVAVIEDYEECLVSHTEENLRNQVAAFLATKFITPPTDAEWAVCILAKVEDEIPIVNSVAVGLISYYKPESKLGEVGSW